MPSLGAPTNPQRDAADPAGLWLDLDLGDLDLGDRPRVLSKRRAVQGVPYVDWDVVTHNPPVDFTTVAEYPNMWCCYLRGGQDQVNFERDCMTVEPFKQNHTHSYFQSTYYQNIRGEEALGISE